MPNGFSLSFCHLQSDQDLSLLFSLFACDPRHLPAQVPTQCPLGYKPVLRLQVGVLPLVNVLLG